MANAVEQRDLLQAARCEDLTYEQVRELCVLGSFEQDVITRLKQVGAHLIEGSRGMGKSMLLRMAEIDMDASFVQNRRLAVYVSFKTSTLLEGVRAGERDGFLAWVNAKILQALHAKLVQLNLIAPTGNNDPYQRAFGISSVSTTTTYLDDKIHQLQTLAFATDPTAAARSIGDDFLNWVTDTSYLSSTLAGIVDQFGLERVTFLFDEAAHTFIPSQQEIFFEVFKLLHGDRVAVKAAVYPSVTSYGRNFQPNQDAIVVSMDRFEPGEQGRKANRQQFRDIIDKRLPQGGSLRKRVFQHGELLDLCIDLSTGNPRAFLHLLNRALDLNFSERAVMLATQEFVDKELLPYHQQLAVRLPKYTSHVRVGLDMLQEYIIAEIRKKNHRETKSGYQAAFFTIQRGMSPNLKLALDLLCYSGILTNKGTVKIAGRETGLRYMVHLALLSAAKAFADPRLREAINSISLTDYREFSSSDSSIRHYLTRLTETADRCPGCSAELAPSARFCSQCGKPAETGSLISRLLEEPVDRLSISDRLKARVLPHYPRVGDVVQAKRDDVMQIKYIKEVRSRIIKNAADEFISG